MSITREQVLARLGTVQDPYLGQDWASLRAVRQVTIEGGQVHVFLVLPYPALGAGDVLAERALAVLGDVGIEQVLISLALEAPRSKAQGGLPALERVKNVIAVASGKGGVGKSTTAVNLALALAAEGARVGILDADIYGPSLPIMLGLGSGTKPKAVDEKYFAPHQAYGVDVMSMGFLVEENTPVVWRGPMATGALMQLLTQTLWSDLDYLIVDMPPGTGDIQLTLAQKVPVAGAVIVTTPQDIALLDAKKGIEMFRKVEIPVLGVVENMALHVCSNCGHTEHIFGEGGGERIAREYQTDLLGSLPLDRRIREEADSGRPTVVAEPEGALAQVYREIARQVGAAVAKRALAQAGGHGPNIFFVQ